MDNKQTNLAKSSQLRMGDAASETAIRPSIRMMARGGSGGPALPASCVRLPVGRGRRTRRAYAIRSMAATGTLRALVMLLVMATMAARAAAEDQALTIWRDPEFQKQFLGTYGVRADVEPRVTPAEQQELAQVANLMAVEGGADKARALLESSLADGVGVDPKAKPVKKGEVKAPVSAIYDFTLGSIYCGQTNLAAAAACYSRAIEKHPSFLRAQKNLGLVYVQSNAYEKAIGPLTRAIDLGAADGLTFGLLAHCYSMTEQSVAAEGAYRQAMMLQPDVNDWKLGLTRCLFKQRKFDEAAAQCGDMLRREPARVDLWLLQANAFLALKQPLKAAENYELLDRAGKANASCLNTLGDIYVNEGVPELAVSAYLRALAKDPDKADPGLFLRDAEVLAARGAQAEAVKLVERVKQVCGAKLGVSEQKRVLKLEARLAAAQGKTGEEQAKLLEEIVALDPLDGEALILLAQHYARNDQAEKAIFLYERAEGIEKHEADAKLRHAQLLVKKTRYADALPLLKRAQELRPREEVARYLDQVERAARVRN